MTVHLVRLFAPSRRGGPRLGVFLAAIASLVALLGPPDVTAQTGSITGRVVDAESQQRVSEALVDLITAGRERVASTPPIEEDAIFRMIGVDDVEPESIDDVVYR